MSIIVEDGTGKIDANSYVDLSFADAYFTERANSVWQSYFDNKKEAALIRATDYIEMRFGSQFSGSRLYPDNPQLLSFPRKDSNGNPIGSYIYDIIDPTLIIGISTPTAIKRATCEYAVRAIVGELITDTSNVEVVNTRVKIGSIEKETTYPSTIRQPKQFASYPAADLLIKPYLKSNSSQLVRS